jgi:hypothetical protein
MGRTHGVSRRSAGTEAVDTIRDPSVQLRCYTGTDNTTLAYRPPALPELVESAHAPVVDAHLLQALADADRHPAPACLLFALLETPTLHGHTLRLTVEYQDAGSPDPQPVTYTSDASQAATFDDGRRGFVFLFTYGPPPEAPGDVVDLLSRGQIHGIDVSEDSESGFPGTAQLALLDEAESVVIELSLLFVNVMPSIDLDDPFDTEDNASSTASPKPSA